MWYAISGTRTLSFLNGDIVAVGETREEVHEIVQRLIDAKKLTEQPESAISHKN